MLNDKNCSENWCGPVNIDVSIISHQFTELMLNWVAIFDFTDGLSARTSSTIAPSRLHSIDNFRHCVLYFTLLWISDIWKDWNILVGDYCFLHMIEAIYLSYHSCGCMIWKAWVFLHNFIRNFTCCCGNCLYFITQAWKRSPMTWKPTKTHSCVSNQLFLTRLQLQSQSRLRNQNLQALLKRLNLNFKERNGLLYVDVTIYWNNLHSFRSGVVSVGMGLDCHSVINIAMRSNLCSLYWLTEMKEFATGW